MLYVVCFKLFFNCVQWPQSNEGLNNTKSKVVLQDIEKNIIVRI